MDCIERIFVLESEQGSAKVVCARENRKNTSMSLMKAIWQKESRQQFLEQTHKKSDFSNALPYLLTTTTPESRTSTLSLSLACHLSKRIFAVVDEVVNYSRPLKSVEVTKNLQMERQKSFDFYLCAFIFRITKQQHWKMVMNVFLLCMYLKVRICRSLIN